MVMVGAIDGWTGSAGDCDIVGKRFGDAIGVLVMMWRGGGGLS